MITIMSVVGARPQFIKAAAVSRALARRGDLTERLVHTGQHFDREMSQVFFDELGVPPPACNLGIAGGPHGQMTGRMLEALEAEMIRARPTAVLVYGDTNSTLAGALAAAKQGIPVAHVEAGLRSYNRAMPEEINRIVVDTLSALLFCPTRHAVANLEREGMTAGVHRVGDVMVDVALHAAAGPSRPSGILTRLGLAPGRFAVATVHRAENTGSRARLAEVVAYLKDKARELPVVMPIHPRTKEATGRWGIGLDGLTVIPPVGYRDMAGLLAACALVLTDSGGLQKEAYFHRKRCITLRDETEWLETVECGWNRLWRGPDWLPPREIDEYGQGRAAERIADILAAQPW